MHAGHSSIAETAFVIACIHCSSPLSNGIMLFKKMARAIIVENKVIPSTCSCLVNKAVWLKDEGRWCVLENAGDNVAV